MKQAIDLSNWGDRFEYKSFHGHPAHCYILRKGNKIIATEAPDNEGTSITNMAEEIADQVCVHFGIALKDLIWIEHYARQSYRSDDIPETFDLVEFKIKNRSRWGEPGLHLRIPAWTHLSREKAEELFGSKFPE